LQTNLSKHSADERPLKSLTNNELRAYFLGWQCRIRQMSVRDYGGAPLPGMRPRLLARSGEELMSAVTLLILLKTPQASTAYFKFQLLRTHDHAAARDAGVGYLAADYFQEPDLFTDEMTALFAPGSRIAKRIVTLRECLLDFEQYAQRFTMFCRARIVGPKEPSHQATLWHNRLFNPNLPNDAVVLGFKPDWKNVHAEPMP
jgi:hypothetical protein